MSRQKRVAYLSIVCGGFSFFLRIYLLNAFRVIEIVYQLANYNVLHLGITPSRDSDLFCYITDSSGLSFREITVVTCS
jgi:hypothetical protein